MSCIRRKLSPSLVFGIIFITHFVVSTNQTQNICIPESIQEALLNWGINHIDDLQQLIITRHGIMNALSLNGTWYHRDLSRKKGPRRTWSVFADEEFRNAMVFTGKWVYFKERSDLPRSLGRYHRWDCIRFMHITPANQQQILAKMKWTNTGMEKDVMPQLLQE